MIQRPISGQYDQPSSYSSPLPPNEDSIPSSSVLSTDLIIRPPRNILLRTDKHKWSSLKSRSKSKIASRNIINFKPGPTRSCKNELDPLQYCSFFITDEMVETIVTHTNAEIAIESQNCQSNSRQTDDNEIRPLIVILTLSAALKYKRLLSKGILEVLIIVTAVQCFGIR